MSKHTALLAAAVAFIATFALVSGQASGSSAAPPGGTAGCGAMGGMGSMGGMEMHVQNEFQYLTQMIPHHQEAIAAAKILQQGTDRPAMRAFAASIIKTQSTEVDQMQQWLAAWYPGRDTRVDYVPMMRDLTALSGVELDRAFLTDMIPHHMMAVMMSQQLLVGSLAEHKQVATLATRIRNTQHAEIRKMNGWLLAWYGTAGGGMGMGMGIGMGHGMHMGMSFNGMGR